MVAVDKSLTHLPHGARLVLAVQLPDSARDRGTDRHLRRPIGPFSRSHPPGRRWAQWDRADHLACVTLSDGAVVTDIAIWRSCGSAPWARIGNARWALRSLAPTLADAWSRCQHHVDTADPLTPRNWRRVCGPRLIRLIWMSPGSCTRAIHPTPNWCSARPCRTRWSCIWQTSAGELVPAPRGKVST